MFSTSNLRNQEIEIKGSAVKMSHVLLSKSRNDEAKYNQLSSERSPQGMKTSNHQSSNKLITGLSNKDLESELEGWHKSVIRPTSKS